MKSSDGEFHNKYCISILEAPVNLTNPRLWIPAGEGNILWDSVSYIDKKALNKIRQLGGVHAIAISHPHFYTSMVDWAREFDCPIYLPEADHAWVMRNDGHICWWPGKSFKLIYMTVLKMLPSSGRADQSLYKQNAAFVSVLWACSVVYPLSATV